MRQMWINTLSAAELVVGGGAAPPSGLSGPWDGAGDRGDPSALPGQEEAHPGGHWGQEAAAAELLRRNRPSQWWLHVLTQVLCSAAVKCKNTDENGAAEVGRLTAEEQRAAEQCFILWICLLFLLLMLYIWTSAAPLDFLLAGFRFKSLSDPFLSWIVF